MGVVYFSWVWNQLTGRLDVRSLMLDNRSSISNLEPLSFNSELLLDVLLLIEAALMFPECSITKSER